MSVAASASNPISSVPDPSASPITSVPENGQATTTAQGLPAYATYPPSIVNRLHLDLRGTRLTVDRETLMTLPESVLLCLFPNGLVLSPLGGQQQGNYNGGGSAGSDGEESNEDNEVYIVDYDPLSFRYVLDFWQSAHDRFYGSSADQPGIHALQQSLHQNNNGSGFASPAGYGGYADAFSQSGGALGNDNPLIQKQPIIVLREELEYFAIPPPANATDHPLAGKATTDAKGLPSAELQRLKLDCGKALLDKKRVFTALQRNVSKEGNMAEQHLIDMLCMSGFSREDDWGYRALEPSRCCISSIALVLLKTGITHSDTAGTGGGDSSPAPAVQVDHAQMATAQKLLLFWRKPARKCWWDGVEVDIPTAPGASTTASVKVWARRVWTLELSLI